MAYQKQNLLTIHPSQLTPHPRNKEFFRDLTGLRWEEFKADIKERGIINPLIINLTNQIISGTQRWRAARELQFPEVNVIQRSYESEDEELLELIYCNIHQRFTGSENDMFLGRIGSELQRILGVPQGRPQQAPKATQEKGDNLSCFIGHTQGECNADKDISYTMDDGICLKAGMSINEIAELLGISVRSLQRLIELTRLNPELQQALIDKNISSTQVARELSKFSSEMQDDIVETIGIENLSKIDVKELKKQVPELRAMDKELQDKTARIEELEEALNLAKGSAYKMSDLDDANAKIDELKKELRDTYEQKESLRTQHQRQIKALKESQEAQKRISKYATSLLAAQKAFEIMLTLESDTLALLKDDIEKTGQLYKQVSERLSVVNE